jgi:hypothetical protein
LKKLHGKVLRQTIEPWRREVIMKDGTTEEVEVSIAA